MVKISVILAWLVYGIVGVVIFLAIALVLFAKNGYRPHPSRTVSPIYSPQQDNALMVLAIILLILSVVLAIRFPFIFIS